MSAAKSSTLSATPAALHARTRRRNEAGRQRGGPGRHGVTLDHHAFHARPRSRMAAVSRGAAADDEHGQRQFRRGLRVRSVHRTIPAMKSPGAQVRHAAQIGQRGVVQRRRRRGAAVGQHGDVVIPHVRVARRAGHAAVGHDAADGHMLDAGAPQHPVQLRIEESRISDLPDGHIDQAVQLGHAGMARAASGEIAAPQERPQPAQVW